MELRDLSLESDVDDQWRIDLQANRCFGLESHEHAFRADVSCLRFPGPVGQTDGRLQPAARLDRYPESSPSFVRHDPVLT